MKIHNFAEQYSIRLIICIKSPGTLCEISIKNGFWKLYWVPLPFSQYITILRNSALPFDRVFGSGSAVFKKLRGAAESHLRFQRGYAILLVYTPNERGCGLHRHYERELTREETNPDRVRQALSGKGLQADDAGGDH